MTDNSVQYETIARSLAGLQGALLPILHKLQEHFGYVPEDAVPLVARVLNLCRAEACCAVGGGALADHARDTLGIDFEETRADGSVSLESVYCLGLCACAPAMRIDDELHALWHYRLPVAI